MRTINREREVRKKRGELEGQRMRKIERKRD